VRGLSWSWSIYFRVMKDKEKRTAGGLLEQTEAVCKVCHNEKSPTFKQALKFDKNVEYTNTSNSRGKSRGLILGS